MFCTRPKTQKYELLIGRSSGKSLPSTIQQGSFQLGFDAFARKNDCLGMKSQRNERKFATWLYEISPKGELKKSHRVRCKERVSSVTRAYED